MQHMKLSQEQNAQFPESMADVRGFEVRTQADNEKVGKVDALVCTPDGQIRYLDVNLGGFFTGRNVALPVGAAQVDRENDVVWVSGMTKEQIKAMPEYTGDASSITDEYESGVQSSFRGGATATQSSDADLYDQGRFYSERGGAAARDARLVLSEEELTIGKRQVQAGEVALRKTVEIEHVRESVPLVREEVTIERRPVSAGSNVNAEIGTDEIRIPLMAEEAVVEKRVVAKEEIVVSKHAVQEQKTVEADLRRERVVYDEDDVSTRAGGSSLSSGASSGAADRASSSGPLDRLADKLDDVKDRVDANPRSRPGPDATDGRI